MIFVLDLKYLHQIVACYKLCCVVPAVSLIALVKFRFLVEHCHIYSVQIEMTVDVEDLIMFWAVEVAYYCYQHDDWHVRPKGNVFCWWGSCLIKFQYQ